MAGHGARKMDEIEIVDYNPRWPNLFDEEAKRLRAILDPSLIVGLEHFGSTAVPALSAKPSSISRLRPDRWQMCGTVLSKPFKLSTMSIGPIIPGRIACF